MSVITITGKNSYATQQKLSQIKRTFIDEYGRDGLVVLSAEDAHFNQVSEQLFAVGLFSQANMLVLKDISSNAYMQDKLLEQLDKIPSESHLIIYDNALDKRSSFFKQLAKNTEMYDLPEADERELVQWAQEYFNGLGGELGRSEAQLLVQRVAADQWAMQHELDKLIELSKKPDRELIKELVEESFNETIFKLLEHAFSGRSEQAVQLYRAMIQNRVEPHYVLSMIIWQLHIVLVAAWQPDGVPGIEVAKQAKISPFVYKKSLPLAKKIGKSQLKYIVQETAKTDVVLKTGGQAEAIARVELLIVRIAQA